MPPPCLITTLGFATTWLLEISEGGYKKLTQKKQNNKKKTHPKPFYLLKAYTTSLIPTNTGATCPDKEGF